MSRAAVLWSLFALQAICCAYFLMDIAWDLLWPTAINALAESDMIEALVTIALFFGLAFTGSELRQLRPGKINWKSRSRSPLGPSARSWRRGSRTGR